MKSKTKMLLTATIVCLMFGGCVAMRQGVMDVTKENALNIQTARQVAEQCIDDWPVISGFIRGLVRPAELSVETVTALARLDEIAAMPEPTDYDLGEFVGLKTRVTADIVRVVIGRYSPNVIEARALIL